MNVRQIRWLIPALILVFILAGCGTESAQDATAAPATVDPAEVEQIVAQTVQAELTAIALANPSATAEPPTPTETAAPPETATDTPEPSPTIDVEALDYQVMFLADISIPDGTTIVGGEVFTKTWRVMNIGQESWTTDFTFVFVNGDRMEGEAINLPAEVVPGGTLDISIPMIAPLEGGSYTGYWMLSTDEDVIFGIGQDASQAIFLTIEVIPPTEVPTETPTPTATAVPPTATP